jgi:phosphatidylinositol dimannoside acyltransferase
LPILPERTPYFAYRAGAEVARLVPQSVGAPIARGIAQLAPAVLAQRRHQVERNLRRIHGAAFGGPELRRAVTATFGSYGRYFYELFRLPTYDRAWIESHFRCTGLEHVAAGVAAGTGVVLALPHLGNWDFAGAWLALQGYPVTVVAEPVEPPELFEWFVETRAQLGMRVVPLSPSAGTEVLQAVRNNEVVCLLSDRDLTGDGVEIEFFGERTTMPGGPAMLALRGGAPLLPAGCYFRTEGRHETTIMPPVPTEREGRIRADLGRVTQTLAHRFEDLIRVAPTHWHLLQPNWPSDRMAAVTT